ncbi:phosphoinositide phosphatase SAC8 isoform X2 [Apium graveolens]|uniref:phosphoinositide phosphatase SAC8 isoform X2 n=1 Tax=Apium graveolens TaxID=4045 RepID=UPI003D7BC810
MEIESNSNHFKLWSELELHEFQDKLVIKAVDSPDQGFSISRLDGDIDELHGDTCSGTPSKVSTIYGVAGTIRLLAGTYILAVTSRREVGTYLGFPIYQVMSMKFLSCSQGSRPLTSEEKRDESYYLNLLKMVESTPGLYYSYETDITVNLQRRFKLAHGWMNKPMWKQADPQYVWNRYIIEELIENKLDGFIMPLLQGSFQTGKLKLKRLPATVTLISRRSTRRLGTRMWRRGANLQGDTANFIETEQLIEFDGFISSFLQVRGSIPLLWEQIVDLSYKPRLNIISHEETAKVLERHFHDLLQRYGETVAVDLTDKHGDEGELSTAYAAEMEKLQNVRYVSFDFHKKCGNGNFDNIQLLYDEISEDFEKQGRYFLLGSKGEILAEQKGVIRSNCIDCLDRTNVTQSFLARKSLNLQLQRVGAFSSIDCITMFGEDFETFKTLWVEQGDEISLEYAGTHALKRDLVRFGKQTMAGLIKDGMSALSRYYYNNFQDGVRQDAIDLISGHYTVKYGPPPSLPNRNEALSYLPVASALLIGGLTVTSITLNRAGQNAQSFLSSLLCASATAGVMALVKSNGRQICSRPRLCGLL